MPGRIALALLAAGLAAFVLTAAGCGSAKKGSVAHGRTLFMNGAKGRQACAYCHTLAAAGTHGDFAPNLDNIFRPSERRTENFTDSKLRKVVLNQIHNPTCADPTDPSRCMPTDLVSGQDAEDIAALIVHCAGFESASGCRPPVPRNSQVAKGQHLYSVLRCQGCHSINGNVALAPTFKGLAGSRVKLASGQTATADDGYLLASILDPDGEIVQGFKPGFMSAVIGPGQVSVAQAKAIIAYIKTLK